jgi:hypothetical protein
MASSPALLPNPEPTEKERVNLAPLPTAREGAAARRLARAAGKRRLIPLPLKLRIGLFLVGWSLVLVGVVGLVVPGIQGVLTLLVGASLLSLVSEIVYELLHWLLARWPRLWRRIEGFRLTMHRRLRRLR